VRDPADLIRQAEVYRRIAQACFAHTGCTAIQRAALLFDRNYAPKPAYVALREGIANRKATVLPLVHDASDLCLAVPTTPCK
jgi:hypothetical protein